MTATAASVAADLARHKEDDRADFNALRSEMGAMEKRLSARISARIDAIGDSIRRAGAGGRARVQDQGPRAR